MRVAFAKLCVSASCRDFPIKEERSPHLWRGDRSNLVADQLPAGRHFCEHEAAMELAGGGFPAVLLLNRGPIDRDRHIAVNPNFHVRIHFNGIQVGSAQVGQALWPREKNLSESWPRRRPEKRVLRPHQQNDRR